MIEQYTDVKNNKYNIIHKTRIDGDRQRNRKDTERRIAEELYRILVKKQISGT